MSIKDSLMEFFLKLKRIFSNRKPLLQLFILFVFSMVIFLVVRQLEFITSLMTRAAPYEAVFSLSPNNLDLQPGERRLVEVYLDPRVGDNQASINGVEFKISYNPNDIRIVDENGNPASQIQVAQNQGDVFYNLNTFTAQNSVSNGEIYLSAAMIPGGSAGDSYAGAMAKMASFYIEVLASGGSTTLSFLPVGQDSADDFMHAYHKDEEPPYVDVLNPSMNGAAGSSLKVNVGSLGVAALSLSTDVPLFRTGDNFNVNIEVDTASQDIVGVDAALEYNSDILSLESITPGSIFASYEGLEVPAQGGVVGFTVSGYSLPGGNPPPPYNSETNPDHVFANLNFKALNPGNTEIRFRFDGYQQSTTDSNILSYLEPGQQATNADDILEAVHNLSLNISAQPSPPPSISPSPTPPPSLGPSPYPSPTPPPPSPSPSYWPWTPRSPRPSSSLRPSPSPIASPTGDCATYPADVNGDRQVNSTDLSIIVAGWGTKFASLSPTACSRDLNKDNRVNVADIQILVSWWGLNW